MDQFKELRAHPKMTKALLEQIESLQKQNHTTGYEKLNDKHRAEIRAKRGGAFAVNVKEGKARIVCTESSCPWRGSNREYCVWPSCFKHSISTVRTDVNEDECEADTTLNEEESVNA